MAGQLHRMLDLLWGFVCLLTRSCTPQGPSGLAGPLCWSGRLLWSVRLLGASRLVAALSGLLGGWSQSVTSSGLPRRSLGVHDCHILSCTPQGPSGLAGPHCWSGRLLWSVRLLGVPMLITVLSGLLGGWSQNVTSSGLPRRDL